jgi:hypothetical protein
LVSRKERMMPPTSSEPDRTAPPQAGPVRPGTPWYRLVERVAEAMAQEELRRGPEAAAETATEKK